MKNISEFFDPPFRILLSITTIDTLLLFLNIPYSFHPLLIIGYGLHIDASITPPLLVLSLAVSTCYFLVGLYKLISKPKGKWPVIGRRMLLQGIVGLVITILLVCILLFLIYLHPFGGF